MSSQEGVPDLSETITFEEYQIIAAGLDRHLTDDPAYNHDKGNPSHRLSADQLERNRATSASVTSAMLRPSPDELGITSFYPDLDDK